MSNVHALLFEGFAAHKLVMRSSHRWDHGTPYPPLPQHFHFSFLLIHGAKIDTPPLCRHWLGFARPCGSSFNAQRASAWLRNGTTGTLGQC
jgi:hypothetical protein